jgi:hypothetical protein
LTTETAQANILSDAWVPTPHRRSASEGFEEGDDAGFGRTKSSPSLASQTTLFPVLGNGDKDVTAIEVRKLSVESATYDNYYTIMSKVFDAAYFGDFSVAIDRRLLNAATKMGLEKNGYIVNDAHIGDVTVTISWEATK